MLVSVAIRRYVPPVAATGSRRIVMAVGTAPTFSRGELARRTGVNIETIRYFERIGLLSTPPRTQGGHRIYDERHVRSLSFIRRARGLGFAPNEVRAIVDLGGPGEACCAEVQEIAERHLEHVRAKIADLLDIERLLAATVERCSGGSDPNCAVTEMLEGSKTDHSM
jgi:MerR family transcriptional regulator, mercuric resistance operon regulatory protein